MTDYQPGDVIFTHANHDFIGRAIQFGEWLRWRRSSKWNHAAIIVGTAIVDGKRSYQVVQAESRGVKCRWYTNLQKISPSGTVEVVRPEGVDAAKACAFALAQVSDPYGFVTIASIAVSIVAPWFFTIRVPGTWVCSALVGECLRAGGWIHDWDDVYMVSPAQLYAAVQSH
jgi:Permuted papain-like amidase enzyme, YaeF/YiiX, C92 family